MSKTKEEIRIFALVGHGRSGAIFNEKTLDVAMDEYAKQEAIAFGEIVGGSFERLYANGKWECLDEEIAEKLGVQFDIPYTTEQLYDLYIQSKTK